MEILEYKNGKNKKPNSFWSPKAGSRFGEERRARKRKKRKKKEKEKKSKNQVYFCLGIMGI